MRHPRGWRLITESALSAAHRNVEQRVQPPVRAAPLTPPLSSAERGQLREHAIIRLPSRGIEVKASRNSAR